MRRDNVGMKSLVMGCLLLAFCVACSHTYKKQDSFAALTQLVDSAKHDRKEPKQHDIVLPLERMEADELFDDFVFNYAFDKTLQKQRTAFPLPYNKDGHVTQIAENTWKHDSLFAGENLYTLLFDREKDMDIVGDTALSSVQVEWIFLKTQELKRYYFNRTKGIWMLDSITLHKMHNAESDFLPFYARFVSDSIYQRKHVCSPLSFITIDPDDDFSILETTLDVEQWFAFRPQMPADRLSNICYGQKNDAGSTTKIIKVNGIGNGYSNVLYFRKTYGKWELYKYEDTSI